MELFMMITAIALTGAIILYTIIYRYTTLRSVRIMTYMIVAVLSLPLLGLCLYVLLTQAYDAATNTWAVGVCGLLIGFWFKRPFSDLSAD